MDQISEKSDCVLESVRGLLDIGKPEEAVKMIRRTGQGSLDARNAYGVCLMRMGEIDKAIEVFRGLVLLDGGVCVRSDVPTVVKTNFATALLLSGSVFGCLSVLQDTEADHDPSVVRLRAAVQRWQASLRWWERFSFRFLGAVPKKPVSLDFSPGDLPGKRQLRPAV